jgi:hypothetical protein
MTLALALSTNPKPYHSSSIRLFFHPNFHLDLVHTKKTTDAFSGHNGMSL